MNSSPSNTSSSASSATPSTSNTSSLPSSATPLTWNTSSLSSSISPTTSNYFACPRLDSEVAEKYRKNELINEYLQLVPHFLLSKRSLFVLKECDKADDSREEIVQHIFERIQAIEITVIKNKSKFYSTDGLSDKSSNGTYLLQINEELFEDCLNVHLDPFMANKAKLRFIITICHEFLHHKMHKYLLNDKWGSDDDETTPPELEESGFYWENQVIGGRIVKINKSTYSFLPNGLPKLDLGEDLCLILLDMNNYDDENHDAYSRKEKEKEKQQSQARFPAKKPRKNIERLDITIRGAQKIKKTKTDGSPRFRLTPNDPLFAEITLINDSTGDIIYADLPQNCGGLRVYLYKYDEGAGEMFTVDLPVNENDWTCRGLRECFRRIPSILPENVIIKPNESKDFKVKLMEITTKNEEENNKMNGHYYLKITMGFYIKETDTHYSGGKAMEFDVEYDNGIHGDENIDATEDERPIFKQ